MLNASNCLECINILLIQSAGQHQEILPCQDVQLQDNCFLRLAPRCLNTCLVYEIHINMVDFCKFIIATGCQGCTIHYTGCLVVVEVVRVVQYIMLVV